MGGNSPVLRVCLDGVDPSRAGRAQQEAGTPVPRPRTPVVGHRWTGWREGPQGALVELCDRCGMEARHGIWMLDDHGRAVTGMVWLRPDGTAAQVLPFAHHADRQPREPVDMLPVAEAYPGAEVGGTPLCPGSPDAW